MKFLFYINNPGDAILDVSAGDVLDPAAFQYLPATIKVDASVDVCADPDCTAAEESAIFAAVDGAGTLTDAVDGDVASFDAATNTIDFGDQDRPNATLDLAADAAPTGAGRKVETALRDSWGGPRPGAEGPAARPGGAPGPPGR